MSFTNKDYPDYFKEDNKSVILFSAVWCGPCKKFKPVFSKVAESYEGKVFFVVVDVDQDPFFAEEVGIESLPQLVFFKDGKAEKQLPGGYDENDLVSMVNSFFME